MTSPADQGGLRAEVDVVLRDGSTVRVRLVAPGDRPELRALLGDGAIATGSGAGPCAVAGVPPRTIAQAVLAPAGDGVAEPPAPRFVARSVQSDDRP